MLVDLVSVAAVFIFIFLPGLAWSYVFFQSNLGWIERLSLSLMLSVVALPLLVYFSNKLLGISIQPLNAVIEMLILTSVGLIILWIKKAIKLKSIHFHS